MGLLFICGYKVSSCVGSYSTVHNQRWALISLLINWLKSEDCSLDNVEKLRITSILEGIIDNVNETIKYDAILFDELREIFIMLEWNGVYNYIIHSDCEGSLDSFDTKDLLDFLETTLASIKEEDFPEFINDSGLYFNSPCHTKEGFLASENRHKHFYLYEIFNYSVEENEEIIFG
jgi:hypothetical protein